MKAIHLISVFSLLILNSCYPQSLDNKIVLINVEHLDRGEIARQIEIINSLNPKVIAIDIQFKERMHDNNDKKLAQALRSCNNLVMTSMVNNLGGRIFVSSGNAWEFSPANVKFGFINTLLEEDNRHTLKRFTVWERESFDNRGTQYHFSVRTAMAYDSMKTMIFIKTNTKITNINYKEGKRKFKKYTANDVLDGKLTKNDMEGKIVLLGFLGPGDEDKFHTPLNKDTNPDMYGLEYLAYVVAQILDYK